MYYRNLALLHLLKLMKQLLSELKLDRKLLMELKRPQMFQLLTTMCSIYPLTIRIVSRTQHLILLNSKFLQSQNVMFPRNLIQTPLKLSQSFLIEWLFKLRLYAIILNPSSLKQTFQLLLMTNYQQDTMFILMKNLEPSLKFNQASSTDPSLTFCLDLSTKLKTPILKQKLLSSTSQPLLLQLSATLF